MDLGCMFQPVCTLGLLSFLPPFGLNRIENSGTHEKSLNSESLGHNIKLWE